MAKKRDLPRRKRREEEIFQNIIVYYKFHYFLPTVRSLNRKFCGVPGMSLMSLNGIPLVSPNGIPVMFCLTQLMFMSMFI
jgi:hypothetical protein